MPVTIEIQNLLTTIPLNLALLKIKIRKVLRHERITSGRLSFVFISNAKMKDLNKKYLRHNFATDVLTFDWSLNGKPAIDGEIIISSPTAKRQAREYGNSIQEEIMLYMIHGLLHLLGYDDHGLKQIKKMRTKENELLSIVK